MKLDQRFQGSEDVVSRKVAGEMVLLDLASGLYFGLDPVGSRIWELLSQSPCSLEELCDAIEAEFDAPREQIERDVAELAGQFVEKNLVTPAAG